MVVNNHITEVTVYTTLVFTINNRAPSPTLRTTLVSGTCGDDNDDILFPSS